ncbi:hypothetical protein AJ80_04310 [Polytolypa hystricis UAMH7299]|uniref:mRNA 3'-end-processing protein RNA14 n=1 Tax=Polytolypa hystricis (strain UAMH7299) TaxID=1447883 RepID=A0A2B7YDE4_POLH7|nr:hypothetical protein AJ80_04310 [Polytolypa hystricis UAMH7299]
MAEDEAERAFFQAQAQDMETEGFSTTEGQEAANGSDSDDYDPSNTAQAQYSANLTESEKSAIPDISSHVDSSTPVPSHRRSPSQDFSQALRNSEPFPSQVPSRSESSASASVAQPNPPVHSEDAAVGGLVVEEDGDDDDEEDRGDAEYEPPAALGYLQDITSSSTPVLHHSPSQSANENVSPNYVSQPTVPDKISPQDVSKTSSHPGSQVDIPVQSDDLPKTVQTASNVPIVDSLQSTATSTPAIPTPTPTSRGRLPHDRVGILEDRIQADPRGDIEAWLELIDEHRSRNKFDNAREVYERFFKVLPSAAEQWVAYASMESENNELFRLEQIFNKSLLSVPNVQLWSVYLDYVRRRNNLTTDTTGQARRIITAAYDFALQNIGIDKDSGPIWVDYIQFIRSGPGNIGGPGWQDQQKMDLLRKAYQRAICVPTQAVNALWKEYDQFEMGLNKLTGRKFLQERSPSYMTARSSFTELQNITRGLIRSSLPKLPPAPGFDGDDEYNKQVEIWRHWIKWEKDDALVLKDEDAAGYKTRVLYVYRQALMALRFLPDLWFEAADFCFQNGLDTEGNDFLKQGIDANPESCLLAFKRADRLEITTESEQDSKLRGAKVREPYDKVLDTLYDLITKTRSEEAKAIAAIEENFADTSAAQLGSRNEDDYENGDEAKAREAAKIAQVDDVKKAYAITVSSLSKAISFAWISLMRSMRRIQGKGKPGEIPGSRQIFADARKRGRITSDVYIASALLEHHCYKDPAATKIFERGAKLFPDDEIFALEYLKHLIDINDITNARAVFETSVRRLVANPANVPKAKPIFAFMHGHESRYGDMIQITNLEARMRELFPEDPALRLFAHRFSAPSFDPVAFRPIISPSQTKPKLSVTVQEFPPHQEAPAPRYLGTSSPKRAFPTEDFEDELNRPRKFMRGESPLKGAAGRRLDQQKRIQQVNGGAGPSGAHQLKAQPPPPLPRDIVFLLSIIPNAASYDATKFSPEKMVNLLRQMDMPSNISQLRQPAQLGQMGSMGRPQYMGMFFLESPCHFPAAFH